MPMATIDWTTQRKIKLVVMFDVKRPFCRLCQMSTSNDTREHSTITKSKQSKMSETATESSSHDSRLGKCEVCNFNWAKYTCPKCEVKTCRLECIQIHKKELECDGIRDKTKYIPINAITESDLMSDYVFLEDCTNYALARKRDQIKRITSTDRPLPNHLKKMQTAARERNVLLHFLLPNFERHKTNTTFYDWKTKLIQWRIEWQFLHASNFKCVNRRSDENQTIRVLAENFFEPPVIAKELNGYRAKGIDKCAFLLKAEGITRCRNRYFRMDVDRSLAENLKGKTIVEYPVIAVVYEDEVTNFDVIDPDEEDVVEQTRRHKNAYFGDEKPAKQRKVEQIKPKESAGDDAEEEVSPKNYFFTEENDSNDGDNVTECSNVAK